MLTTGSSTKGPEADAALAAHDSDPAAAGGIGGTVVRAERWWLWQQQHQRWRLAPEPRGSVPKHGLLAGHLVPPPAAQPGGAAPRPVPPAFLTEPRCARSGPGTRQVYK
jgi:hypothetical protein